MLLQGRYTRDISNYQLTIPRRLSFDGAFASFDTTSFFEHDFGKRKRKRSLEDPHSVHYGIMFNGAKHHVELWPNHGFVAPGAVFERRQPNVAVQEKIMKGLDDKKLCHYTGRIRNVPGSRVAVSTCDGLVTYLVITLPYVS